MKARSTALGVAIGCLLAGGLTLGITEASASGPNTTYYACLKSGKLTHVGTSLPTCPVRSTSISWNSTGPQGPSGPTGPSGSTVNLKQIGALRWYQANEAGNTANVGVYVSGIRFDGSYIWTASPGTQAVDEIDTATMAVIAEYHVGTQPEELASDGQNLWVALYDSNEVVKLQESTGTILGTYSVGSNPDGVAFSGN